MKCGGSLVSSYLSNLFLVMNKINLTKSGKWKYNLNSFAGGHCEREQH